MKQIDETIKTFIEKKATAETMRTMWITVSVAYVGFLIFMICMKEYSDIWYCVNILLLSVTLIFNYQAQVSDHRLVISSLELEKIDREILEMSKGASWVSVEDQMPPKETNDEENSIDVIVKTSGGYWYQAWYNFRTKEWFNAGRGVRTYIEDVAYWMNPNEAK